MELLNIFWKSHDPTSGEGDPVAPERRVRFEKRIGRAVIRRIDDGQRVPVGVCLEFRAVLPLAVHMSTHCVTWGCSD